MYYYAFFAEHRFTRKGHVRQSRAERFNTRAKMFPGFCHPSYSKRHCELKWCRWRDDGATCVLSWLCGATARDRAFLPVKHQQLEESSADFRVMQYEDAAPKAMRSPAHHSDAFTDRTTSQKLTTYFLRGMTFDNIFADNWWRHSFKSKLQLEIPNKGG